MSNPNQIIKNFPTIAQVDANGAITGIVVANANIANVRTSSIQLADGSLLQDGAFIGNTTAVMSDSTGNTQVYAQLTDVGIQTYDSVGNVYNTWLYSATGNVAFPGSITGVANIEAGIYGSPAPYITGFSTGNFVDRVSIGSVTLTSNTGAAGQVLTTHANGLTYWSTVSGGGSPGGTNAQVQFNDAGVFGGDAGLTYNKSTDTLSVTGNTNTGNLVASEAVRANSGNFLAGGTARFAPSSAVVNVGEGATQLNLGSQITGVYATGNVEIYGNLAVADDGNGGGFVRSSLIPGTTVTHDLGSNTNRWRDLWLSNSTIHIGNAAISANGNALVFTNPEGGTLSFEGNANIDTSKIANGNSEVSVADSGNITITANSGNAQSWLFTTDGNIGLPAGGSMYSLGSTPSGAPGNTIVLQPSGVGTTTNQKLMVYPTAGDGDHIHLVTGNLYQTELFLGSDNFYAKLSNTGNFEINTNDDNGNSSTWTFSPQGTLTIPNGGRIDKNVNGGVQVIAGATGTVRLSSNNDQNFWIFDETGQLRLALSNNYGVTGGHLLALGNVIINADTKGYRFGQDGNFTLPGNTWGINFANGNQASAPLVDVLNTNGLTTTMYPTFVENRTDGQIIRADVDLKYRTDNNTLTVGNIRTPADNIILGNNAALIDNGSNVVIIGANAATQGGGNRSVSIGYQAGYYGANVVGDETVAIGANAGYWNQSNYAVAIGSDAGYWEQSESAIAIGRFAGAGTNGQPNSVQRTGAIAIGDRAGSAGQGNFSIALGANAGRNISGGLNQNPNSIVINATGTDLTSPAANTLTIKPIRGDTSANLTAAGFKGLMYNPTTGEICYVSD